eukprot:TRINITY_DN27584_c0_g1_i1.p1 TRINITY_DN27584_c0_g1~~TRINITY_DN27584_c0_g1_i1.p1  ORF type:complete len:356 (-),score=107.21 TRINITY_DN27584_c0_g1_i1:6-1073(-)
MEEQDDEATTATTCQLEVSRTTYKLLEKLRKDKKSDDEVVLGALHALGTLSIVTKAFTASSEVRKACTVVQQMRGAGFDEDMIGATCRALFGDQSEKDMKRAFKFFDKNNSESLDKAELRGALPLMGVNVPQDRIDELFKLVDADNNGDISLPEFTKLVKGMNPKAPAGGDDPFATFRAFTIDNVAVPDMASVDFSMGMGGAVSGAKQSGEQTFSALSTAWNSKLEGLSPLEMRKAGVMLENMKNAGYTDAMATAVVNAVLVDQSDKSIKKAFNYFDKDKSGQLDMAEVKEAMPLMGEDVSSELIEAVLQKVDVDGNAATVNLAEFGAIVRGMNPKDGEQGLLESLQGTLSNWVL